MKTLKWIFLLLVAVPLCVRGDEPASGAKVVAISGNVSFAAPSGAVDATVGAVLPVGSVVTTTGGGQATLQFFNGTVVIVQPESNVTVLEHSVTSEAGVVTKENTMLDLHAGGVVASLDPAKKNISNFRVRTPKGVAAARGTVLAVRIGTTGGSVTTFSGTVTFITDQGEITVNFGQTSSGNGVLSVADAVKANPSLATDILDATSMVAKAVGDGNVSNTSDSPNLVTTVLAALVDVAVQVAPDNAQNIVRDVLNLSGQSGSAETSQTLNQVAQQSAARTTGTTESSQGTDTNGQPPADQTKILPPLDQTQIIVSPSQP